MTRLLKRGRVVLLTPIVIWLVVSIAVPHAESADRSKPWKGRVDGVGEFYEFVADDDGNVIGRIDVDTIVGQSTHMGRFTGAPESSFHALSFIDLTFVGQAIWRAANGDELYVSYHGFGFPNTDPDTMEEFPIAATAIFIAEGGTGRFSNAAGEMVVEGGFTSPAVPTAPIYYSFDFDGTLFY